MKKVKVVTQGGHVIIKVRSYLFFWTIVAAYEFDPDAIGSRSACLENVFRYIDKLSKSLKEKPYEEISL